MSKSTSYRLRINDRKSSGNSGDITINSSSIELDNADILNQSPKGTGLTGDINLSTDNLKLTNGSRIANNKFGMGNGKSGSINLEVTNELIISSSKIGSETVIGMVEGGDVSISTGKLTLDQVSSITSSSRGMAKGGVLTINAQNMDISSGSFISSSALSRGNGGRIVLNISDKLTIGGTYSYNGIKYTSQILSRSVNSGDGGNIDINCGSLSLSDGGAISTASEATKRPGDAGNISISTGNMTVVDSEITAESTGSIGGQIDIDVDDYAALINSSVKTKVHNGSGDAGNITIDSRTLALNNSIVEANAFGGDGGNIFVDAQAIILNYGSGFDASSVLGISGDISVTAPQVYINEETEILVTEYLPAEDWVDDKAKARLGRKNSFVIGHQIATDLLESDLFKLKLDTTRPRLPKKSKELQQLLGF